MGAWDTSIVSTSIAQQKKKQPSKISKQHPVRDAGDKARCYGGMHVEGAVPLSFYVFLAYLVSSTNEAHFQAIGSTGPAMGSSMSEQGCT